MQRASRRMPPEPRYRFSGWSHPSFAACRACVPEFVFSHKTQTQHKQQIHPTNRGCALSPRCHPLYSSHWDHCCLIVPENRRNRKEKRNKKCVLRPAALPALHALFPLLGAMGRYLIGLIPTSYGKSDHSEQNEET